MCPQSTIDPPDTNARDTIFALASGAGRAAISVVRLSGPRALATVHSLAGRLPEPRRATLARLRDPASGDILDEALLFTFEAPRSELGEDGAELHLHGSPAVVAAVLSALARQPGLRQAEPGEFARRAFANGKMDLAQLEGLADLIDAETDSQRRQAQRQLSGAMRAATAPWREALIAASAEVETAIDFAEDVALETSVQATVLGLVAPVRDGLRHELAQAPAAERIRDGLQIVIAGPPNAGKSTLLNALVRREAAIVSAVAGTTRDPIEVHLDLGGLPVTLVDTAGLRESRDAIEEIGVFRARERADAADLVLWLTEDGTPPPAFSAPVWRITSKCDARVPEGDPSSNGAALRLSAMTGENLPQLVARLTAFAEQIAGPPTSGLLARARHREAFAAALAALDHVAQSPDLAVELIAEDLRAARFALDRLIGKVDVEDILDDLFSRFCIGK